MPDSLRLALPLLDAAQAQKHVTHNEALVALDALVQLSVSSRNVLTPPFSPAEGARVLVGAGATGVFVGHAGAIAAFDNGGWSFFTPRTGWRLHVADENALLLYDGTVWNDVGLAIRQLQNLSGLGVGTASDSTNALAAKLNAALFTARATGEGGTGDVRVLLNKSTASNTASYLFQTGYSGRAEAGLTGSNDFALKVSSDGASWHTGLSVDAATGVVSFPSGTGAGISRLRSGAGAPAGVGNAGDFWIDTTNSRLYGPYVGPSWPTAYLNLGGAASLTNIVSAAAFATPILPNGSDMTAALNAALTTLYAIGGGVIQFDGGTYRFDGAVTLPYDGSSTAPKGVPIAFQGLGEWRSGKSTASAPNGGTQFDIRYANATGWLRGLAEAPFVAEGITFTQKGTSAVTTPFMFFTNTVPMISRCGFEGHSSRNASNADQDCIILGGTSNASFGGDGLTQPFQGYGAVVERCHFNRVRRGVYGRVYANGIVVRDNCFWAQCGGATAIEFNSGTTDYCVGGVVSSNLIEAVGYTNPISLTRGSAWTIVGNNIFDEQALANEAYVKLTNCVAMIVIAGSGHDTVGAANRPYVNDTAQCSVFLSMSDLTPSTFRRIRSGNAGYPNLLGPTVFTGNGGETLVQPTIDQASGTGKLLTVKRSAANSTGTAGAEIFSFQNDGAININPTGDGSMAQAGNIINGLSSGAGWSANGRTWVCNGTGGAMTIDSGSGGSSINLRGYNVIYKTQAGTQYAVMHQYAGEGYYPGLQIGVAGDVALYRVSATLMKTNVPLTISPGYTVATLPAAAAALKGARSFVTDAATSPAYGATASGGGSAIAGVLCTGSAWIYG